MALNETALNLMADELASAITHIGLADAGGEVTGGGYARQAVAWGSATGGVVSMQGTETFSVPGGEAADRVLLMGHASDASPAYGYASFPSEAFGSDGELTVMALTITVAVP